jgi:hypothetical protein
MITLANCPSCKYPLRPGVVQCPSCGLDLQPYISGQKEVPTLRRQSTQGRDLDPDFDASRSTAFEYSRAHQAFDADKLPDPNAPKAAPASRLRLLALDPDSGELLGPSYTLEQEDQVVGRDQLDPENPSISRNQAQLTFTQGKWRVRNLSRYMTTSRVITEPTDLAHGDVLLLGNAYYKIVIE